MRRPRYEPILLALLLAIVLVAGCDGDDEEGTDGDADTDGDVDGDVDGDGAADGDVDGDGDSDGGSDGGVFDVVEGLGACVNLGNWLEAPDQNWGVVCDESDIARIAEAGFGSIRLPVRWETRVLASPPYTIEEEFFALVDDVLGWAAAAGLDVVVNMHHHEALFADAPARREQFLAMWEQIATRYRDQPPSVLFEIMNEPHGTLTAELWNEYLADALAIIRESNPTRAVVVGTASWGGIAGLAELELPDDPNLVVTFHYYDPFRFTHQGAGWVGPEADAWLGTTWDGTYLERLALHNDMTTVARWAAARGVPVFMGEFGAYGAAAMDSRARWTEAVAVFSADAGFAWCYWEYKAGFGLWDPSSSTWRTELVDALFSTDTSILELDPGELGPNLVTNGDFEDGLTGWRESFSSGTATAAVEAGVLVVDVTDGGSVDWGLQVLYDLPPLAAGRSYALLFDAWASPPRAFSAGVQQQGDPWTVHGMSSFVLADEPTRLVVNFTMGGDDASAAIVFNVGGDTGTISLDDVVLVEVGS